MKVLSVCVSEIVEIEHAGQTVPTGLFKRAVEGPRMLRETGFEGDRQGDLTVHGGVHKAVHAFPVEHYAFYQRELGQTGYESGHFGENLTTEGILEDEIHIGDQYQVGDALLEVSRPRSPCFKFGIKLGTRDAVETCLKSKRSGFYFRVVEEGYVGAGDPIGTACRDDTAPTLTEVFDLLHHDKLNQAGLSRAIDCPALAPELKKEFAQRLRILRD